MRTAVRKDLPPSAIRLDEDRHLARGEQDLDWVRLGHDRRHAARHPIVGGYVPDFVAGLHLLVIGELPRVRGRQ